MNLADTASPELRALVNELYGAVFKAYLETHPDKVSAEQHAALAHVDKKLREHGFMPASVKFTPK